MDKCSVLIADDEELELQALELMINSSFDITVIKAKNGKEAVELARTHRPKLLILDIQMPVISGLDAADQIREFLPYAAIVFLTAWGRFEFAQRAIRLGAEDYLVKPVSQEKIREIVEKYIQQETIHASSENCDYDNAEKSKSVERLRKSILDGNLDDSEKNLTELFKTLSFDKLKELYSFFAYDIERNIPFLSFEIREQTYAKDLVTLEDDFFLLVKTSVQIVNEDKKDKYSRIFRLATDYIERNFGETLTAETVAQLFNMQSAYFSQLFRKYTGSTFVEYVTQTKIKQGAIMLKGKKSVTDTAAACGYSDINYFSRVFKKHYGVTPSEYSQLNQE